MANETIPESGPTVVAVDAWKHFLGKNYILNGLDNALYNVYSLMLNVKVLWESSEKKYKTEDVGSKKLVAGKFLDFKMVDSKTVMNQVQEFQLIPHDIHAEEMVLGESFQVAALIEKLPPTWKDFKNYLKHKRKEIKLEDLMVRLRIEEDNRQSEKKVSNYHQEANANMVEKDSEQTKQIEELQKQNEELGEEKERLLEEIERIISETGKMHYTIDSAVLAYWGSTQWQNYV
ncbi:hypothetical protein RJ639_030394 [Escallonia herrerae]|uniref:Uncharacterized protein n=1 Tax=Escallonia herrerae TaxID=1293975 RepID=A0AA88X0E8_9ASTE|nr:hypothetical protein RJ639_030394 [Escallonia herrerae]